MTRIPKDELKEIVKRDLPGYELVKTVDAVHDQFGHTEPDEVAPSIDELRRKYLGEEPEAPEEDILARMPEGDAAGEEPPHDEIVVVQRDDLSSPLAAKRVVVSGRERRVIGSQG